MRVVTPSPPGGVGVTGPAGIVVVGAAVVGGTVGGVVGAGGAVVDGTGFPPPAGAHAAVANAAVVVASIARRESGLALRASRSGSATS